MASCAVYMDPGGDTQNVGNGGTIAVADGGAITLAAGAKLTLPYIEKSASWTVDASESGAVYLIKAADVKATLPSTAAGLTFTFIVHTPSTTTGFQVDPAAADAIHGGGQASTDNKDLINTAATDAEGDTVTIVGDGVDGWWITSIVGTWAEE